MRRLASVLGLAAAVPVLLAVPVLTRPAPAPHPVDPHVASVDLTPLPATRGVLAQAPATRTHRFSLVGAAWHGGSLAAGATIQLRTHDAGSWSGWTDLQMPDGGPDDGSTDARAAAARHATATDPLWVGHADGVQARVVDTAGRPAAAPAGMHLVLVDGGSSGADGAVGPPTTLGGSTAEAAQAQPTIYTRSQWGANESLRSRNPGCGTPSYGSTIKMGFIHHTDTANGYSSASVPSIIRSIYAYHVESNGWCDIGYNFLVDRFGRVWEGRYGGISRPVIGAHTGGFNSDTFGASLIGNYTSTAPTSAMLTAVERLFAWKLGGYYRDPLAKATTTAGSFSGSRFAAGSTVTFNVVSGHRDADTTTCPGSDAYAKLGTVRGGIVKLMGAGFVAPSISPATIRMLSGQTVGVRAGVVGAQTWSATVVNAAGVAIRTLTGSASRSAGVASAWDGTGADGLPAPPGSYTVTLTGADSAGHPAVPFVSHVTVTPPVTVLGPSTAPYDSTVTLTGTAAPNAAVTVALQSAAVGASATTLSTTASPAGSWQASFVADNDYTWSATSQGWTTATHTTKVAPSVALPTDGGGFFAPRGTAITLHGTALPGTTVSVPNESPVTVAADGTWSGLTVTPAAATPVAVSDARGVTSPRITAYGVGSTTASAPSTGYSQRTLAVTGNAGGAPLSVQLWTQPAGAAGFTLVKTATAATTGAFSVTTVLPQVSSATPFAWRVVTTAAQTEFGRVAGSVSVQPTFAPTVSGPASGFYGHAVPVSGTAVPGDAVTLWTRPASGGSWSKVRTVTANGNGGWAASYVIVRDTAWKVTSRSGSSSTGSTVARPSLHTPATAAKGAVVTGWGYAIPGQKVVIYRRPIGTASWRYVVTVTSASNGRWTGRWHMLYPMYVQARSHGQVSPTRAIASS